MTTCTLSSSFKDIAVAISNDWNRLKQYIQLYFYEPNIYEPFFLRYGHGGNGWNRLKQFLSRKKAFIRTHNW